MTLDVKDKMYSIYTIILGASGVGKTTICVQVSNMFNNRDTYSRKNIYNLKPTIGMEFFSFNMSYMKSDIKVNIWDTAGEKRFDKITETFYNHVAVVYFVYDCARMSSVNWVKAKYMELRHRDVICMMIGNIIESESASVQNEALVFATKHNLPIFRVSAINGFHIKYPFIQLTNIVQEYCVDTRRNTRTIRQGIVEINKSDNSSPKVQDDIQPTSECDNAVEELVNTKNTQHNTLTCQKHERLCKCILL